MGRGQARRRNAQLNRLLKTGPAGKTHPDRSVVEGPALPSPCYLAADHNDPTLCHLDRSAAQWRDLRFLFSCYLAADHNDPPLCHLDRSAAQWRDLRFLFSCYLAADHNDRTLCHLDRSEAQWRDLRFYSPAIWL